MTDIKKLFKAIAHGDTEHRNWLEEALYDFEAGRPVKPPRGKGNSEQIETAAQALVDKLDEISPLINDINVRKENLHNPIDFRDEVKTLKIALERKKAMDELIAGDADQYDASEWGEPFYGSDQIGKILNYYLPSGWAIRGLWVNYGSFNGCAENLIYRLRANHPFYQTDLFKNAKKPDADHPCLGGE